MRLRATGQEVEQRSGKSLRQRRGVDWKLEEGMVVAAHVVYPGDDRTRCYIEEIGAVGRDGQDRFFTWDFRPLRNE